MPPTDSHIVPTTPTEAFDEVAAILAELARTAEYLTPAAYFRAHRASYVLGLLQQSSAQGGWWPQPKETRRE